MRNLAFLSALASLTLACSAVYPSGDFTAALECGGDVERYAGAAPCPASVFTCANRCEMGLPCCNDRGACDDMCVQACQLECVGENPECMACILRDGAECVTLNGCQDQWDDYDCCARAECGQGPIDPGADYMCINTRCATEAVQYDQCSNRASVHMACDSAFLACVSGR